MELLIGSGISRVFSYPESFLIETICLWVSWLVFHSKILGLKPRIN